MYNDNLDAEFASKDLADKILGKSSSKTKVLSKDSSLQKLKQRKSNNQYKGQISTKKLKMVASDISIGFKSTNRNPNL